MQIVGIRFVTALDERSSQVHSSSSSVTEQTVLDVSAGEKERL